MTTTNESKLTAVRFELNGKSYKSVEGLRFYELKNSRWVGVNGSTFNEYAELLSAFRKETWKNPRTICEVLDARFANKTCAIVKVS